MTSLNLDQFAENAPDDHLELLSTMRHLLLRTLILDRLGSLCESKNLLAHTFGRTLEVLHLGKFRLVKEETLLLLGSTCSKLKELSCTCKEISSEALASSFGSEKAPLLEKMTMLGDAANVNDQVVLTLCANHPNLQFICINGVSSISLSSVAVALSYCSRFESLITNTFQFITISEAVDAVAELPYYKLVMRTSLAEDVNMRTALRSIVDAPFYRRGGNFQEVFKSRCRYDS